MKTLVIHPYDITTNFLKDIYAGKDWTVINDTQTSKKTIKQAIKEHDRIVMLGHGTPHGLVSIYRHDGYGFDHHRFMIDSSLVYLLREKEIVAIWCNADQFVEKYGLKGFYTGMIISEDIEANMESVIASHEEVDDSNVLFTEAVTKSIDAKDMLSSMITEYTHPTNPIIGFNMERLYKR